MSEVGNTELRQGVGGAMVVMIVMGFSPGIVQNYFPTFPGMKRHDNHDRHNSVAIRRKSSWGFNLPATPPIKARHFQH